jgi:Mg2+/Co2+ transporter CorC
LDDIVFEIVHADARRIHLINVKRQK